MNQNIHCLISNCHYWSHGNKCEANEIIVTHDKFGAEQPDRIDAHMANQLTPSPVDNCMSTCCKTFVLSGTSEINVDGVKRK
jgi:hypothetical protein